MVKKMLAIGLLVAATGFLTGCGKKEEPATSAPTTGEVKGDADDAAKKAEEAVDKGAADAKKEVDAGADKAKKALGDMTK